MTISAFHELVCGGIAGAFGIFVGQPLDTTRIRLQTQSSTGYQYKGFVDCLARTVKQEGFLGLFKGFYPPAVGATFQNAILFVSYDATLRYLNDNQDHTQARSRDAGLNTFVAGAIAGGLCTFVTTPIELIKVLQQVDRQKGGESTLRVARNLFKTGGLRSLFRGFNVTLLRDMPSYGLYYASYEWSRETIREKVCGGHLTVMGQLLAGGVAGVATWFAVYPVDIVKTRLQIQTVSSKELPYAGFVDCCRRTYAEGGARVFTRGLGATIFRAFPVNAVTFLVYEELRKIFHFDPATVEEEEKYAKRNSRH